MRAVDIIQKKRDALPLQVDEIAFFIGAYSRGEIPDYQASAFAMATYFQGMNAKETLALTEAMMHSGQVLDLSDLDGPKVDKHSTGGVGDKTSMILAPLVAACGAYVPMISGRGLGHTGGTLDKLESIPGMRVNLSIEEFRSVLGKTHLGLIGQTPEIAPADRKLYALRDVTATVESPPLIAASIMSKKMAEGIDALILDVKTGDGAFMRKREDALQLARTMVGIGKGMGRRVTALVTDMEQPLGRTVGNALEIVECIETLKGRGPKDLESLSVELATRMLLLAGITDRPDQARTRVKKALATGDGLRKFQQVIELQGGDPRVCDDTAKLPRAAETLSVHADQDGRVSRIACRQIGVAAMLLGAGRETVDSRVDPAVGIVLHKKVGDPVVEREILATLHINDKRHLEQAAQLAGDAIRISASAPPATALIRDVLD